MIGALLSEIIARWSTSHHWEPIGADRQQAPERLPAIVRE